MQNGKKKHILAVEDNPDTLTLLRYMLQPRYHLALASTVDSALEQARASSFDLFLLDINLGEERTGIELLGMIREMEHARRTPALALTAYAMPGDRDRFMEAGFDGYVSKPFTRRELNEAIESIFSNTSSYKM